MTRHEQRETLRSPWTVHSIHNGWPVLQHIDGGFDWEHGEFEASPEAVAASIDAWVEDEPNRLDAERAEPNLLEQLP